MKARPGMSLVELIVAFVILSGALLALAKFSGSMTAQSAVTRLQTNAVWLATDRIETAKSHGTYAGIDSLQGTESSIAGAGNAHFTRQTTVKHVGGAAPDTIDDYRVVTVVVTHPQLTTAVTKTAFIAAF